MQKEHAHTPSKNTSWWAFFFDRGISVHDSQLNAKRIVLTNSTLALTIYICWFFCCIEYVYDIYPINYIFLFYGCIYVLAWWLNRPGKNTLSKTLTYFGVLTHTIALSIALGPRVDFKSFYIPISIIPFLIFNKKERILFFISLAATLINIVAMYTLDLNDYSSLYPFPDEMYTLLNHTFNIICICCMIILAYLFMSITELGEELLLEKTTLLEKQNIELEKRRKEQEKLNHVKDRLLSIIAHDLKNPIHNLQGISDLILQNSLSREESEFIIKKFKASAQNTSQMLDNLLTWSSAELNKAQKYPEKITLKHFIEGLFEQVEYRASQKEINLINAIQEKIIITTDRNALEIVLRNVVLNAIKFSYSGQNITVQAEEKNGMINIQVIDHGIGIPEAILHKLFEADTNKSRHGTQKEKGFGLGLMLCKQLVEQNEGTIRVTSIPGQITTLSIEYPSTV